MPNFFKTLIVISFFVLGVLFVNHRYNETKSEKSNKDFSQIPKYDQPQFFAEFDYERFKNPITNKIPVESKLKAYQFARKNALRKEKDGLNGISWEERGPNNVAGRTRALMFDPNDGNNEKLWAGSVGGGLWYNNDITDANESWQNVDDFMGSLAISCLAYDPSNTQIFYAGTGEGFFNSDALPGLGVWKSEDGGSTWSQLAATIPNSSGTTIQRSFRYVQDIAVASDGTVFATTRGYFSNRGGLLRSEDGGASWEDITPFSGTKRGADIEIAANGDLYVSFGLFSTGSVYRSTDNGDNFTEVTPPDGGVTIERIEMAIAPSSSSLTASTVIYAIGQNGSNDVGYIQKSSDGGDNWTNVTVPAYVEQNCTNSGTEDFSRGQAWYDLIASVKPDDPDFVIIGGIDLFRSEDGGSTWERISDWADRGCSAELYVHADQHALVYRPGTNNEIISGSDGGVSYASDVTAAIVPFSNRIKDYNVTQFYACDLNSSAAANEFLAGAQDNGTQYFTSAGMNSTAELTGGDGAFCFFDDEDAGDAVTSYVYNNFYFFVNGSYSGASNDNTGRFINPATFDSDNDIVYSASDEDTYYEIDMSGNITSHSGDFNNTKLTAFSLSPYTDNLLFVANNIGDVFKVEDANTGSPTVTEITGLLPNAYIHNIAIGSTDDELLVCYSSYGVTQLYYTDDGGGTWTDKTDNLADMPILWALFNPNNSDDVLIATEYGVWSTDNLTGADQNWELTSTGLANVRCEMIQYRESDNLAIVATHGRGLYSATVFDAVVTADWNVDASGNWEDDANWGSGVKPTSSDDITLDHGVETDAYTVTINSSAEVGNLTISDADIELVIAAGQSLSYSTISGSGSITLEDGASLVPNNGATGNVDANISFTVKRNKPNDLAYYNFWSSPVTSGNTNMLTNAQSIYQLDMGAGEASSFWNSFSGAMTVAKGYAATNVAEAVFTGTVNNGDIQIAVEENSGTGGGNINMVGNPYPSAISASEFVSDNAGVLNDATIHLFDQGADDSRDVSSNFIAINNSGASDPYNDRREQTLASTSIASCQGFQVLVAADGNINFQNDQRNTTNNTFKSGNTNDLTLKNAQKAWFAVEQDEVEINTLIAFGEQATEGYDFYYDCHDKLYKKGLHINTINKNRYFRINAMSLDIEDYIIPLSVTVKEGDFSILCSDTLNFSKYQSVFLKDKYTNTNYRLKKGEKIEFENDKANSWQDRFIITFMEKAVSVEELNSLNTTVNYRVSQDGIILSSVFDESLAISVFGINGQKILISNLNPRESKTLKLEKGNVYLIQLNSNDQSEVFKVSL